MLKKGSDLDRWRGGQGLGDVCAVSHRAVQEEIHDAIPVVGFAPTWGVPKLKIGGPPLDSEYELAQQLG